MTSFADIFDRVYQKHHPDLGHNDALYLQRIFSEGLLKYEDRVKAIDFINQARILDAGCGFGQWSLALAKHNVAVSACDISPERIEFLHDLAESAGVHNIEAQVSRLESLPYEDDSFDAVFCYGVIILTPWRQVVQEFKRILKHGGKLYINASGLGWYNYLWHEEPNKADDYDPKAIAAKSMTDTLRYDRDGIYESGMNLIIDPEDLQKELRSLGFVKFQYSHEGRLHLRSSAAAPKPFFQGEYYGQLGDYEIVCAKIGN